MEFEPVAPSQSPMKVNGEPYLGIAFHVRERAEAGDLDYVVLWRSRSCHWCETIVDPMLTGQHRSRTFDHVVPRSDRGGDEAGNLLNSYALCNHIRGTRHASDFLKLAALVIRPYRNDLVALGGALLEWDLVPEARVAFSYAGLRRSQANRVIHAKLGAAAFDPETKKGFEDLAYVLSEEHAAACVDMTTFELEALVASIPHKGVLRRSKSAASAQALGWREASVKELEARDRGRQAAERPRP